MLRAAYDNEDGVADPEKTSSSSASSSAGDGHAEILYQRVFYQLTSASAIDLDVPPGLVLEERVRFRRETAATGADGSAGVVPYGHRTLLWRDGTVNDGEIGDVWFDCDIVGSTTGSGEIAHHHDGRVAGPELEIQLASALVLAHTPHLFHGKVLQVACGSGIAGLLGCVGAGLLSNPPKHNKSNDNNQGSNPNDRNNKNDDDPVLSDVLTVPSHDALLPLSLDLFLLTDADESNLELAAHHLRNVHMGRNSSPKVTLAQMDWTDRTPYRPGLLQREEFRSIVACDVAFTYPEARELARTVAHRLQPNYYDGSAVVSSSSSSLSTSSPQSPPSFVHVSPENRPDLPYLHRLLERGYRMQVSSGYPTVERLVFQYQSLPAHAPESDLDDLPLELAHVQELPYRTLSARHHPDYAGAGSGEWFFPLETGEYDAGSSAAAPGSSGSSGSGSGSAPGTYPLERESNRPPPGLW